MRRSDFHVSLDLVDLEWGCMYSKEKICESLQYWLKIYRQTGRLGEMNHFQRDDRRRGDRW